MEQKLQGLEARLQGLADKFLYRSQEENKGDSFQDQFNMTFICSINTVAVFLTEVQQSDALGIPEKGVVRADRLQLQESGAQGEGKRKEEDDGNAKVCCVFTC